MKKFFKEFRDFALKGNVMDLAVGVIIGAAFQGVVTSLTDNILSPIIGFFAGDDFSDFVIPFFGATIKVGAFINSLINFLIMAFVVFLLVKAVNKLTSIGVKPAKEVAPTTKKCPYCFTDIPIQATRCPNCTAQLPESAAAPAKG